MTADVMRGRNGLPWPYLVLLLLSSGGGLAVGDIIGDGTGDAALAKVERLEPEVAALRTQLAEARADLAAVKASRDADARMMRDQGRAMSWIVGAMTKQSAALQGLAKKSGVEVDLAMPPLLPEGVTPSP